MADWPHSTALFRHMLELTEDGIVLTTSDDECRICYANRRFCELTGYQPADVIGQSCAFLRGPGTDRRAVYAVVNACRAGVPYSGELLNYRRDGSAFWNSVQIVPVRAPDAQVTHFIGRLTDVTRRREMAGEINRLVTAVQQCGESIYMTDLQGRLTYANNSFLRQVGRALDEVLGRRHQDLYHVEAHERSPADVDRDDVPRRFQMRTHDDRIVHVSERLTAVRDDAGMVVGFVGVQRDVTREVALEHTLRQAQKMEAIGTLASGVAHDFNNVLTVILFNAELLKRLWLDEPRAAEALALIDDAARQAGGIVQALLTFGRNQAAERQPIDLAELVAGYARMLRRLLPLEVELITEIENRPAWILGNEVQLQQVLFNLAINARDAMRQSGTLSIRVDRYLASDDQSEWRVGLVVQDSGGGISPEALPHLFEPYFTTKERGQGTGLGLAIVDSIVRDHGGNVQVFSSPGHGATFAIEFPGLPGPPEGYDVRSHDRLPRMGGDGLVLIIESDARVRGLIHSVLQQAGCEVIAEAVAERGVARVSGRLDRLKLIIIDQDVEAPSRTPALTLLSELGTKAPLLVMSQSAETFGQMQLEPFNVTHLKKPFSIGELREAIVRALLPHLGAC